MQAFHNDTAIKAKYVERMKKHIEADELVRNLGFENGKGCAVGCTLNNYRHSQYPIELGIPEWLARVEDRLFEGMSIEKSKLFPLEFLEVINVGADLEQIKYLFLIFIVESTLDKFDYRNFPNVKRSIDNVLTLLNNNESDGNKLKNAANVAYAAAGAAYAAAYAAYAANNADVDAYAAAYAANNAYASAYAAAGAVTYAVTYAANAAAYANAYADTRQKTYNKFADKLLELIKNCK